MAGVWLQHTLDEITYVSVKWGRLQETVAFSRALMKIRHAHDLNAQHRVT
jgi:hypothetical protein